MKHRIQITHTLLVAIEYAFDVEYDTETGEAEIVSQGHAVSHPDTVRRRELLESTDFESVDDDALIKLIDEGKIERPGLHDTVMHSGRLHQLDPHHLGIDEDVDPEDVANTPAAEIVEALIPTDRIRRQRRRRFSRRRREGL